MSARKVAPPKVPSFHAFSIAVPSSETHESFVIAGSGEAQEGAGPYASRTVRYRETSADALREKAVFVLAQMETRMARLLGRLGGHDRGAGLHPPRSLPLP